MNSLHEKLQESLDFLEQRITQFPHLGIILGSGLGDFTNALEASLTIAGQEIPHCPIATVADHAGVWTFGKIGDRSLLALKGRVHFYEGYSLAEVVYPIYLMHKLGICHLIVTNAAGGINSLFRAGDFMLIEDHINFFWDNPLIGAHNAQMGPRFPDMSRPYYPPFLQIAEDAALDLKIPLRCGVLFGTPGPSYETAAEIEMIRRLGGDAVSMSTVPEVIVANQLGIKVLGLSCITNMATGISQQKLSHGEVTKVAGRIQDKFRQLLKTIINRLLE